MGNWCSNEPPDITPDIHLDEKAVRLLESFKTRFRCNLREFTKKEIAFTARTREQGKIHCRSGLSSEAELYNIKVLTTVGRFEVFPCVYLTRWDTDVLLGKLQDLDARTNGQLSALRPAIDALAAQLDAIDECINLEKYRAKRAALRAAM